MKRNFLNFEQAREYARALKLTGFRDWRRYCDGQLKELKKLRPSNIPSCPEKYYLEWKGWADWLGTNNVSHHNIEFWSFQKAREFARNLKLKNTKQWELYLSGDLPLVGERPQQLPKTPNIVYKEQGWKGLINFIGCDNGSGKREFLEFENARSFVRELEIKSRRDWREYAAGKLKDYSPRPLSIPSSPDIIYRDKGWAGWVDWLGLENYYRAFPRKRIFLPFNEAREFARKLKLKNQYDWINYSRGDYEGTKGLRPKSIPSSPHAVYENIGWISWKDWLGS